MSLFQKAVKAQAKLRMSITGPAGSGKTFSALSIAAGLANGGRVALVDTEHGSAEKYAGDFDFDVMKMEPPFHPDRVVEAIKAAASEGYTVIVLDSLSHYWNGTGGMLEIVDQFAAKLRTANTFAAWKDATPIQNRLIDAIVRADIHVIATMRSKTEYVVEQVERGGKTVTVPRKVGTSPVQRDAFDYEFDVAGDLDLDHNLIISKTRCRALDNAVINKPGRSLAEILRAWLSDGAPVETVTPLAVFAPAAESPKPTNGNGKRAKLVDRIRAIASELETAGETVTLDEHFLLIASDDELTALGRQLRGQLDRAQASIAATLDPDGPETN